MPDLSTCIDICKSACVHAKLWPNVDGVLSAAYVEWLAQQTRALAILLAVQLQSCRHHNGERPHRYGV